MTSTTDDTPVLAGPEPVRVECTDYQAHQLQHRRSDDGWICVVCQSQGEPGRGRTAPRGDGGLARTASSPRYPRTPGNQVVRRTGSVA